jgi:hypothetical protein
VLIIGALTLRCYSLATLCPDNPYRGIVPGAAGIGAAAAAIVAVAVAVAALPPSLLLAFSCGPTAAAAMTAAMPTKAGQMHRQVGPYHRQCFKTALRPSQNKNKYEFQD